MTNSPFKRALQPGLILAAFLIVLSLISWMMEPTMMLGIVVGSLTFLGAIGLMIYFGVRFRKEQGGFISFKTIFVLLFLTWIIGSVISVVFGIAYTQVADDGYIDRLVESTLESTYGFMEGNVPEDQIEKQLIEIEKDMRERFTIVGQLTSALWYILFGAVLSLILAAFMKKEEPILPGAAN